MEDEQRRPSAQEIAAPLLFSPRTMEESSLRRAGLFQPSFSSSMNGFGTPMTVPQAHSQDSIRLNTMQLSGMDMFSPPKDLSPISRNGSVTPRNRGQPSGLSLLRPQSSHYAPAPSPVPTPPSPPHLTPPEQESLAPSPPTSPEVRITESTPLLSVSASRKPTTKAFSSFLATTITQSINALPAVVLGCLLNILDGLSYGMIIFPATSPFEGLGPAGVSMFFVSCVVAQLTYTFGGSTFAGANGSMMIEVVVSRLSFASRRCPLTASSGQPFFHIIASSIAQDIGLDRPQEIIATTIVAFALSSILTGLAFFVLGYLRLGALIGFFPRHILVGCIGGVGVFLIETGLAVSLRVPDDALTPSLETIKFVFLNAHSLLLWTIPLALAILLRVGTEHWRWRHQLIFPAYFLSIPLTFYFVVLCARLDIGRLRSEGWIFEMVNTGQPEPWYSFYKYYNFKNVQWGPLWDTIPTQFALLFFNILHPPLNVPALSVSLNEDVDTDKELVAHGYSNLLAGALGTVPNYLVYVNTLLFYRVGGGTRVAGFLLALATAGMLLIGTGPIAYIPVMVVAALIFVLGIDLCKEALWDTRHRVNRSEYITIVLIMVCMTVWDFVIGVLFGILVSCFFFVVENSQRASIRALHSGETAMSTVRRPSSQRDYIRDVSKQTTILRLQGFLFFGTITQVEATIRGIMSEPSWLRNPVRFLVLDFSLVGGVDLSAAEAFVRIHRLLAARYVTLVFCGFGPDGAVGRALASVDVLGSDGVELFETFGDAMEWTENAYLRAWFRSQKSETSPYVIPGRQDSNLAYQESLAGSFVGSPRRSHLRDAGHRTIANETRPTELGVAAEPYNTLVKAFSSYGDLDLEQFRPMLSYLERVTVAEGLVLWRQGDAADGLYIIESGTLRAQYSFSDHAPGIEESMVPGTLAGELSALSNLPRNASVVAERPAVLWRLSLRNLRKLEEEEPALARKFTQLVLKAAKIDNDILLAALASRR
ncbi:Sulfate transporter family protein [Mycena indigotica]|uniref:Sulfate transporter family protein n=1 Tax=Mycena indigotica TaxID=2126181 RepID=A0A8H6VQR8_9AGAR|nr:Sulfate transporter family protein [Mycena indigotica]KAF7290582.1 Sulfate transporter family protein [Mycena indigotica]